MPPTRKKKKSVRYYFQQTRKEKQNSAYVPRIGGGGQVSAGVIIKNKIKNVGVPSHVPKILKWRGQAKPSQLKGPHLETNLDHFCVSGYM